MTAPQDHGPPLLMEMVTFCEEAAHFLLQHPENIIAVHCKVPPHPPPQPPAARLPGTATSTADHEARVLRSRKPGRAARAGKAAPPPWPP